MSPKGIRHSNNITKVGDPTFQRRLCGELNRVWYGDVTGNSDIKDRAFLDMDRIGFRSTDRCVPGRLLVNEPTVHISRQLVTANGSSQMHCILHSSQRWSDRVLSESGGDPAELIVLIVVDGIEPESLREDPRFAPVEQVASHSI